MKQIFYLCLALALSTTLSAQLQQLEKKTSSISLTGGLMMDNGLKAYNGSADYRYMLSDRLMVGLGLEGSMIKFNSSLLPNEVKQRISSFLISPSMRYYLSPKDKQMQWFIEGRVGLGNARDLNFIPNAPNVSKNLFHHSIEFGAGISRFIAPGLMLEGQFGYRYRSRILEGQLDRESLFFELRLRPFFNGLDKYEPIEITGKWLVDGHFQWKHDFNRSYDRGVNFKLEALRFVSPRIAWGGTVAYDSQNGNGSVLNGTIQGRYYINPRQRLQLFLKAELGAELSSELETLGGGSNSSILYLDGRVELGVNYYLNKRMALEYTTGFAYGGFRGTVLRGRLGLKYLIGK